MQTSRTQIGDVSYNAATQTFEALVTFHTQGGRTRVAARVPAPLDEDPQSVIDALRLDALERRTDPSALHARLDWAAAPRRRSTYMPPMRRWYEALVGRDAA